MNQDYPANPIRDLVEAANRQWRFILTIFGTIVAVALVGSLFLQPTYRAASRILLTSNRASISTSPDHPSNLERSSDVSDTDVGSQVEIIGSVALVAATLRDLGVPPIVRAEGVLTRWLARPKELLRRLSGAAAVRQATEPDDPMNELAALTAAKMEVAVVKRSNIIEIAFTARDPVWARDFVNRLTSIYLDRHAALRQTSGAEDFFNRQSDFLKQKLGESEAALRDLRARAGTIAGQRAEVEKLLAEFTEDLARTGVAREEQSKRVGYIESVRRNTRQGRLATPRLLELETLRAEMVGKYKPDSEKVRQVEAQIDALRTALGKYDSVVATEGGGAPAEAGTDPVAARATLAALEGKEAALARQRDEYKNALQQIEAQSFDLVRLERQVKIDEDAYLSYVRAAEQSRLSSALEQSRLLRLTVVDRAELPREPIGPLKGPILGFAVVAGLAVALGLALLRDRLDTTVRSISDIRKYGNVEVLTVVRRASSELR